MSKLSSVPRLSRDDLQGAPEWVEQLLQVSNEFQEQATARLNKDLLVGAFSPYDLKHNTEVLVKNPFGSKAPAGVSIVKCDGLEVDSSGKPTGKLYTLHAQGLNWRMVQTQPGQPQRVGVTARYAPITLGENISSSVASGSAVTLTTGTTKTITSITLTPGQWDISAVLQFTGSLTGTASQLHIATTTDSTTGAVLGDSWITTPTVATVGSHLGLSVPSTPISLTSSTTYYLTATCTFSAGTCTAYGRISATRRAIDPATTGRVVLRFDRSA